jgi:hypothetical protein
LGEHVLAILFSRERDRPMVKKLFKVVHVLSIGKTCATLRLFHREMRSRRIFVSRVFYRPMVKKLRWGGTRFTNYVMTSSYARWGALGAHRSIVPA